MRTLWLLALTSFSALAIDNSVKDWPAGDRQKARMEGCSAQAEGKSGTERKAFMSECLKGRGAPGEKATRCDNEATAKGLKGDDRTQFVRTCVR
jgi:hypothetical protein